MGPNYSGPIKKGARGRPLRTVALLVALADLVADVPAGGCAADRAHGAPAAHTRADRTADRSAAYRTHGLAGAAAAGDAEYRSECNAKRNQQPVHAASMKS